MKAPPPQVDPLEFGDFDRLIHQAYRELENSRRIAQDIIANARNEAADMVTRAKVVARRQIQEVRQKEAQVRAEESERALGEARQAYETAFAQGLARGEEEGRRRLDATMAKVAGILEHLNREKENKLLEYRDDMIDLVLQISERVIRVEQETIASLLGENLKSLLEECASKGEVFLYLNPEDLAEVCRYFEEHCSALPRHRISPDDSVPRGECRVRGKSLNLDLSFDRRFEAIRDRLRERLGRKAKDVDSPRGRSAGSPQSARVLTPRPAPLSRQQAGTVADSQQG